MPWIREEKYFLRHIFFETKSYKLSKQIFVGSLTIKIILRKAKFIVGYTNFKSQVSKQSQQEGRKLQEIDFIMP